jgi:two-component system response regulator NreC
MVQPPDQERKIRVLLADDHAVLRAGLKALLNAEPDLEVVGEAADGEEVVQRASHLRPDVIVMDIQMPRMSGLEATRTLKARNVASKVLILTMHAESQYLLPLLEAGGSGYVLKSGADTELIEAIRTVHRGEVFLYPAAAKLLVEGYLERSAKDEDPFDGLTEREREVLKFVAEGYSGTEIAERLVISPKTVDTYRERIMQKLGLRHRWELVRYALRKGMLKPEPEQV